MTVGNWVSNACGSAFFEPFYRAPGVAASGHGLGLAITRRLMHAHGGTVELRAEPGGGTRAVLALPAAGIAWKADASARMPGRFKPARTP